MKTVPQKRTGGKIRRSDFRIPKRTASEFASLSNITQKEGCVALQAIKVDTRSFSAVWRSGCMKSAKEQQPAAEADEGIAYAEKGMLKDRFPHDQICGMARGREFLPLHGERFDEEFCSIAGDNGGAFASLPQLLPSTLIDCAHASCEHSRNKRRNVIIRCFFLKDSRFGRRLPGRCPERLRLNQLSPWERPLRAGSGDKQKQPRIKETLVRGRFFALEKEPGLRVPERRGG